MQCLRVGEAAGTFNDSINSGASDDNAMLSPPRVKHLMVHKAWCCFAEGELRCEPMAAHASAFDKTKNSNQPPGSAQHIPARSGL